MAKTLDAVDTEEEQQRSVDSAIAMDGYLRDIYDRKVAEPDDGIFSALITAEHEGDRLTKNKVISNIRLLYVAGHETTTNLIGNGLVELVRHPEQLEMVRRTDEHDTNLVEEVLRFRCRSVVGRTSVSEQHSPGWKARSRSRASFDVSRTALAAEAAFEPRVVPRGPAWSRVVRSGPEWS